MSDRTDDAGVPDSGRGAERPLSSYVAGFLAARRYAPSSRQQRRHVIARFCKVVGDPSPADLTIADVHSWWGTVADGVTTGTAQAYHAAVKMFLLYLRDIEVLTIDPMRAIRRPANERRAPTILSDEEVDRVIAACPDERTTAVVAVMLGCGLRCVDAAQLMVDDVDLDAGLMVVRGKGGHRDLLAIPSTVADALRAYLEVRPAGPGAHVFRHRASEAPVQATGLRYLILRLMQRAGVKRFGFDGRGPHALRRTFASTLLDAGASIRDVQVVMRHSSLATTERYLRRPEAEELRAVMEAGAFRPGQAVPADD